MTCDGQAPREIRVRIHRDHLYIDAVTFDRHLAPVASVALLRDNDDLLILPVSGFGGFYVKQVNAQGDRAIHAADFFRLNGIGEMEEHHRLAVWAETVAGFAVRAFFADVPAVPDKRK